VLNIPAEPKNHWDVTYMELSNGTRLEVGRRMYEGDIFTIHPSETTSVQCVASLSGWADLRIKLGIKTYFAPPETRYTEQQWNDRRISDY